MMKKLLLLTALASALAGLAQGASADERYRVVTPVATSDTRIGSAPRAPQPIYITRPARQPLFGPAVINAAPSTVNVNYQSAERPAATKLDPMFLPQRVAYEGKEKPGTIVIDTNNRFLYLVGENGSARRYGVGVGKPGFEWAGKHKITRKAEWPDWTPPKEMISREAKKGHILPAHMEGGEANPLGARAMYLGSTEYRIHGTNAPWTIGYAVSSGCIRMRNEDVVDLYGRVKVGTNVIVK
ncbi:L,D-transpeptidase [Rhizobium sp. C1]|uniref:L,D-transpeptidase n=1 Tax=Rhizobium sp. C1 TaxID=1349799 RepID=UPI001E4DBE55|nr:L,D-transpeptidase [Rhizobium sp. C1]MCD2179145.1 L,D-transpeptidase [Rhizobium sp. C1]